MLLLLLAEVFPLFFLAFPFFVCAPLYRLFALPTSVPHIIPAAFRAKFKWFKVLIMQILKWPKGRTAKVKLPKCKLSRSRDEERERETKRERERLAIVAY